MLQNWCRKLHKIYRFHRIAWQVRRGIMPKGTDQGEIMEALRYTKKSNVLEMFGFLKVRIFHPNGILKEDLGLQSIKLVTTAFANYVVDSLQNSTTEPLDAFQYHDMGDDNTAESNAHTSMQNSRESRVAGTQVENGAGIYQSVANITATAGYDVEEHGIFSAATVGTMLDRNLVPNAPTVIADDVIEFTYELTVNAEAP